MNSAELKATVDPESTRRIKSALEQFPLAVQDRLISIAFKKFFKQEKRLIAPMNNLPAKDLRAKCKIYGNSTVWGAVSYRTSRVKDSPMKPSGRALRQAYDANGTGWRSHFEEVGTHTWSSTLRIPPMSKQLGRGWKRGLYHRGRGKYLRGTNASVFAHRIMAPQFRTFVIEAIDDAVKTANLERRQRLRKVAEY